MDTLTSSQRHKNMSHIRGKDTKPENEIRSALHKIGFRFRKNDSRLPGKPDIVLPHYKAVIFVNGCLLARPHRLQIFCNAKNEHRVLAE